MFFADLHDSYQAFPTLDSNIVVVVVVYRKTWIVATAIATKTVSSFFFPTFVLLFRVLVYLRLVRAQKDGAKTSAHTLRVSWVPASHGIVSLQVAGDSTSGRGRGANVGGSLAGCAGGGSSSNAGGHAAAGRDGGSSGDWSSGDWSGGDWSSDNRSGDDGSSHNGDSTTRSYDNWIGDNGCGNRNSQVGLASSTTEILVCLDIAIRGAESGNRCVEAGSNSIVCIRKIEGLLRDETLLAGLDISKVVSNATFEGLHCNSSNNSERRKVCERMFPILWIKQKHQTIQWNSLFGVEGHLSSNIWT